MRCSDCNSSHRLSCTRDVTSRQQTSTLPVSLAVTEEIVITPQEGSAEQARGDTMLRGYDQRGKFLQHFGRAGAVGLATCVESALLRRSKCALFLRIGPS